MGPKKGTLLENHPYRNLKEALIDPIAETAEKGTL